MFRYLNINVVILVTKITQKWLDLYSVKTGLLLTNLVNYNSARTPVLDLSRLGPLESSRFMSPFGQPSPVQLENN